EALATRSVLDRRLQRVGEAKRDARCQALFAGRRAACAFLRDVDEGGLLAGQANVDVSVGELCGNLQRRLGQQLEQTYLKRGRQSLAEPLGRQRDLLVADAGQGGQLRLQRLGVGLEMHLDAIMTSRRRLRKSCSGNPRLRRW